MTKTDLRAPVTRRSLLKRAATLGAGAALPLSTALLPAPAIAAPIKINFSLAWLPEGGTNFVYVSQPHWKKHGLDVTVSRGYGSVATAKAVANNQFPFAHCAYGAALLSVMRGLDLKLIATLAYDSTMGVAVSAKGPIKAPQGLDGKKVGIVPTSGEAPYFPAYMQLEHIDPKTVTKVALDDKVLEQTMIRGNVDAITMFAVSSLPVFVSQKFPVKIFLYSTAGLNFYNLSLITRPDYLEKNTALCEAFLDGMLQGLKYSLLYPKETLDQHMKSVPELQATSTGLEYARLGMGISQLTTIAPESREHGLGYGDLGKIDKQVALIKKYVAPNEKLLKAADIYTNQYIGHVTLTAEQWAEVKKNNAKIAVLMGEA